MKPTRFKITLAIHVKKPRRIELNLKIIFLVI